MQGKEAEEPHLACLPVEYRSAFGRNLERGAHEDARRQRAFGLCPLFFLKIRMQSIYSHWFVED